MNAALNDVPVCPRRSGLGCGGATVCGACLQYGVSRAIRKLLKGSVAQAQLSSLVATVWPEATPHELTAVATELVSKGQAIVIKSKNGTPVVEHALWPFLKRFCARAVEASDPVEYARQCNKYWLVPLITPGRLHLAGLHVVEQPGTARVLARQQTLLNATSKDDLSMAVRRRGLVGTPTSRIFEEYDGAFDDLFQLVSEGDLVIDEGLVWHVSVVGKSNSEALKMWRSIVGLYDDAAGSPCKATQLGTPSNGGCP